MANNGEGYNLRVRPPTKQDQQVNNDHTSENPKGRKRTPKSAAQAQRDYRSRIKSNDELFKKYREYENLRVHVYKASMSEEKKASYREKTRERVRRYRERKRAEGTLSQKNERITRCSKEKQRETWKNAKAEQRARRTSQAVRRENERRRKNYAEKKMAEQEKKRNALKKKLSTSFPADQTTPSFSSKRKLMQIVRSLHNSIPKSPNKAADVMTQLLSQTAPTCKSKLLDRCIVSPRTKKDIPMLKQTASLIKATVKSLNPKRSKGALQNKWLLAAAVAVKNKYWNLKQKRENLGFGYKSPKRVMAGESSYERKKRRDSLHPEIQQKVQEFFNRGDVSRSLPDA
ncbi:hypothetical protein BSL78_28312 [Apostichopus japonicus]|uniref:Uncharacterized protein n=1 Tax=Stichopus japonicus TaxID=307972 RepID=A0A2G8JGI2_STIJA|nr:hypothetical protein BSL78_28312 [Apostichopus japonicus]